MRLSIDSLAVLFLMAFPCASMGLDDRTPSQEVVTNWQADFEEDRTGTFPSGWVKDANASETKRNRVQAQQRVKGKKALPLHGVVGGCWGALAYRNLRVKAPFEVSMWVRNGTEKLSGCHPHRCGFGLRVGKSWRSPSRSLALFDGKGQIIGGGKRIANYKTGRWYHLSVRYRVSGEKVIQDYKVDGKRVNSIQSKRIETESQLKYLELSVQEGDAWFDGVVVRELRQPVRRVVAPVCEQIPAPSNYAILVSAETYRSWGRAVRALRKRRRATILRCPEGLSSVRDQLAMLAPKYACFVARPEEAGREFVVQVHRLTRALDEDPYGDCIWGILTGYEADAPQQCSPESQMIRLRRPMRLTRESCQDVIAQLLSTQGWALSVVNPGAEIYRWVHRVHAMQAESIPGGPVLKPEEVLAHPYRRIPIVTKLELEFLRVDLLGHHLNVMFPGRQVGHAVLTYHAGGNLTEPAGGVVALWGMSCYVAKALTLLRAADQERAQARDALNHRILVLEQTVQNLGRSIESLRLTLPKKQK